MATEDYHTLWQKQQNEISREWADNNWKRWTPQEIAYLLESDEKLKDIAKTLGRTFKGCKEKRKKLRREMRRKGEL